MRYYPQAVLFLSVVLRLRVPELIVFPGLIEQQTVMIAALDNGALIEHQYFVAETARG